MAVALPPVNAIQNQLTILQRDLQAHLNTVRSWEQRFVNAENTAKTELMKTLNEEQRDLLEAQGALDVLRTTQRTITSFMQLVLAFTSEVFAATQLVHRMAGAQTNELLRELPQLESMEANLNARESGLAREAAVIEKDLLTVKTKVKDVLSGNAEKLAGNGIKNLNAAVVEANDMVKNLTIIKKDILRMNQGILAEARQARVRLTR
jgi:hypothetical protein